MTGIHFLIRQNWDRTVGRDVLNGLVQSLVGLVGVVVIVMLLPISQVARENILKFGGLILTGIVAFSSTTVIRDAAAGVTLRLISPFSRGDYLETEGVFGRVTEIGFFYTEVQTEDRSLVTLMNSNLLGTNFNTIPSSGTLLTTEVSLGYDVHHDEIESALKEATEKLELEDPFVHVEELGNFSVKYKVAGLLDDVENLLTARSDFRKAVLDSLHQKGIEIVSPNFMNRRNISESEPFVPEAIQSKNTFEKPEETTQVVFEKALEAKEAEDLNKLLDKLESQMDKLKEADTENADESIEVLKSRKEAVEARKKKKEEEISD